MSILRGADAYRAEEHEDLEPPDPPEPDDEDEGESDAGVAIGWREAVRRPLRRLPGRRASRCSAAPPPGGRGSECRRCRTSPSREGTRTTMAQDGWNVAPFCFGSGGRPRVRREPVCCGGRLSPNWDPYDDARARGGDFGGRGRTRTCL